MHFNGFNSFRGCYDHCGVNRQLRKQQASEMVWLQIGAFVLFVLVPWGERKAMGRSPEGKDTRGGLARGGVEEQGGGESTGLKQGEVQQGEWKQGGGLHRKMKKGVEGKGGKVSN